MHLIPKQPVMGKAMIWLCHVPISIRLSLLLILLGLAGGVPTRKEGFAPEQLEQISGTLQSIWCLEQKRGRDLVYIEASFAPDPILMSDWQRCANLPHIMHNPPQNIPAVFYVLRSEKWLDTLDGKVVFQVVAIDQLVPERRPLVYPAAGLGTREVISEFFILLLLAAGILLFSVHLQWQGIWPVPPLRKRHERS